jgi:hypothetical protein
MLSSIRSDPTGPQPLQPSLITPNPLFRPSSSQVRRAAANIIPELLHSAVAAASKGGNADMSHVKQLLDFIWPPLIEALGKEPDVDVLPATLDAVSSIVDMVEPGMIQQEWVQVREGE